MTPTELAAILEDHRLWLAGEGGSRADLANANLRDANLRDANLDGANLEGANLENANLRGADLEGADLANADLRYANLRAANLRDANIWGATLRYADLANADLENADLEGADLEGANLRAANLRGANLRGATLRYANLDGANLDEARGLVWARSGPCGIGPRQILGWWTAEEGLVVEAGCFRGTPTELRQRVADGGWDWPSADHDRLAASVEKHLRRVEADVHEWLAAEVLPPAGKTTPPTAADLTQGGAS